MRYGRRAAVGRPQPTSGWKPSHPRGPVLVRTQLVTLQARQFDGGLDPLIDQLTQPRIGSVALIGIVLAPAARCAAHVVLAAEGARPQRTERGDLGLDRGDAVLKDRVRSVRHAPTVARGRAAVSLDTDGSYYMLVS